MFHIWQFGEQLYNPELSDTVYMIDKFREEYKKNGYTKEFEHDIMVATLDGLETEVFAYMCSSKLDYNITVFFYKIRLFLLQKWIVSDVIKRCEC